MVKIFSIVDIDSVRDRGTEQERERQTARKRENDEVGEIFFVAKNGYETKSQCIVRV